MHLNVQLNVFVCPLVNTAGPPDLHHIATHRPRRRTTMSLSPPVIRKETVRIYQLTRFGV